MDGWRDLDDATLAAELSAHGVTDLIVDRLVADRGDGYVDRILDRYLDPQEDPDGLA